MSTTKQMRELREALIAEVYMLPEASPESAMRAICDHIGRLIGRPVVLRLISFPPGTATGVTIDLPDRLEIWVEEGTAPAHQLVICGHEAWHAFAGDCTHDLHDHGVAARALAGNVDLLAAVRHIAARSPEVSDPRETAAETFGIGLGAALSDWLSRRASRGPLRRDVTTDRLQISLGVKF